MNNTVRNFIIILLLIIYIQIVGDKFGESDWGKNSIAIACSIIAPIIAFAFDSILKNYKNIKLWISTSTIYCRKKVRMSMSYIYRIKINDKYLLVKNSKWKDQLQPVGGAYKKLSNDLRRLEEMFQWSEDDKLETTGVKKNDFRGYIPAPKVIEFLKWFKTGKNREVSHWREFCEELIRTDILSYDDFPHVEYSYAGSVVTPLKDSKLFGCKEILSYDVYDLIPTPEQEQVLLQLQEQASDKYAWVSSQLINTLGFNDTTKQQEYTIGDHTKWTLNMKYVK